MMQTCMLIGPFLLNQLIVQNYTAGNPALVLYIKNLAKDVTSDDFYLIFGELSDFCTIRASMISVCI